MTNMNTEVLSEKEQERVKFWAERICMYPEDIYNQEEEDLQGSSTRKTQKQQSGPKKAGQLYGERLRA
jgi:hypothetical protein